ncbi:MAG: hypothetical protein AVDCRST_MAG76-1142 [uncultured Acidimicrobiales bacterium]|uniref:IPT/TIG domain-containing protein n=1 Tax=uncultured Acidimicrobiales bacterium TaxID=310071 RepID=A0A6J4HRS8_9ACTN|nr:MAG: hypothetical protein AVDCRST_MAG76-1142 [uncultured Acidimicrobiales bacterium]
MGATAWRRALAAVTLLAGTILFPTGPATPQSARAITLNPTSAPAGTTGTWAITVSGTGFPGGTRVNLRFDNQDAGVAVTNRAGAFSQPINPGRRPGGTYRVEAYPYLGPDLIAAANFTSVPPMRAYDQPSFAATGKELCGPAGPGFNWSLHVSGASWRPDTLDALRDRRVPNVVTVIFFRLTQAVARINATVRPDGTWRVDGWPVPAQPAAPAGTYTVRGIDSERTEVSLPWTVPCVTPPTVTSPKPPDTPVRTPDPPRQPDPPIIFNPPIIPDPPIIDVPPTVSDPDRLSPQPVLACSPCLGPPGFVTQLAGTGFPPGAAVTLRWTPGLGDKLVNVDATGSFSTQMLVMPGDPLGPRQATGEVAGGGPKAATPFLVVPLTVTPSGRDVAQLVRLTQLVHR